MLIRLLITLWALSMPVLIATSLHMMFNNTWSEVPLWGQIGTVYALLPFPIIVVRWITTGKGV